MLEELGANDGTKLKVELAAERKLKNWVEQRSVTQILEWFDAVTENRISTPYARRRITTESTAHDQLFLKKLGVIPLCFSCSFYDFQGESKHPSKLLALTAVFLLLFFVLRDQSVRLLWCIELAAHDSLHHVRCSTCFAHAFLGFLLFGIKKPSTVQPRAKTKNSKAYESKFIRAVNLYTAGLLPFPDDTFSMIFADCSFETIWTTVCLDMWGCFR